MKTKNIALGFTSLILAVSSAFASLTITPSDYISVIFENNQNFTCIAIQEEFMCDGFSTIHCVIQVLLKNGSVEQAHIYDFSIDKAYCTTSLFDMRGIIGTYPTGGTPILAVN